MTTYDVDRIDVAVLAGGINLISLFDGYNPGYKGLIPLEGKLTIQFVLDALREVPQVARICIVGPSEIRKGIKDPDSYEFAPEGKSVSESIFSGLGHFSDSTSVLLIPADLPLITPPSIIDFLKKCGRTETLYDASIFWAMVPEKSFSGPFRKVTKGYNRFRDISVCHGNLYLMTPSLLENKKISSWIDKVYDARKSSVMAALEIGLLFGLSYIVGVHLLRVTTLDGMARNLSRRLGMGIIPVLLEYPEVAVDIDNSDDYVFVLDQIKGRKMTK